MGTAKFRKLGAALGGIAMLCAAGSSAALADDKIVAPQVNKYVSTISSEIALVQARLDVKANGSPSNVQITGGYYPPGMDKNVTSTINAWTFKPATVNGTPADWYNYNVDIALGGAMVPGASSNSITTDFYSRTHTVPGLITSKQFAQAKTLIDGLIAARKITTLPDYALAEGYLAEAELGLGHNQAALDDEKRADTTALRDFGNGRYAPMPLLPGNLLMKGLNLEFFVERQMGLFKEAMATYARMGAVFDILPGQKPRPIAIDPQIKAQADALKAAIDADDPLVFGGAIEDSAFTFSPPRLTLTITNLKGTIDHIDAACDLHKATIPFQADVEWTLPSAWGNCELAVAGAPGTTFTVVEFKHPNGN